MNRKIPFMMAVALLLGAATLPGVFVPMAAAEQRMQVTQRRTMLTVFYDMLLVLAGMIVWFVFSAALMDLAP